MNDIGLFSLMSLLGPMNLFAGLIFLLIFLVKLGLGFCGYRGDQVLFKARQ